MIYNKPETIYYKAAKKPLHSGMKVLSQERLQTLKQGTDFISDLQKSQKQKDRNLAECGGQQLLAEREVKTRDTEVQASRELKETHVPQCSLQRCLQQLAMEAT